MMRQDVRYAFRSLASNPGFALVAVLTLALGIGANTAIFSVVRAVLLKPLAYRDSSRLVRLYENVPAAESPTGRPRRIGGMDLRALLELRARSRALSHVISYSFAMVTATVRDEAVRLSGSPVAVATFPMLGVQPRLGRWFVPGEDAPGHDKVIVLSDGAWQRCFGGDPNVVGKAVTFTSRASGGLGGNIPLDVGYTVVGVMPRDFRFPDEGAQFWTPLAVTPPTDGRPRRVAMMARLADGVSMDAAVAEVRAILHDLRRNPPGSGARNAPPRFELARVADEVTAPVKPALLVLTVAVGFVLLIACANVANLLLARDAARERETAVRIALGAGRGHLVRQTLAESVMLALLGGAAGTALAFAGVRLFQALGTTLSRVDLGSSATFPRLDAVAIDASVLAFAIVISVGTGTLFGLAPAVGHSRASRMAVLRDTATARPGVGRHPAQSVLVVAEIAMATLLFVGGALLIRSFGKLASVDLGYDPTNVLTFQVGLPGERRRIAELKASAEDLVARLRSVPGVLAAAYANQLPTVNLRDTGGGLWRTADAGRPPSPDGPDARLVSRYYLDVMGVRVIAGRGFGGDDRAGQPRALLINQALARRDFADVNPIGSIRMALGARRADVTMLVLGQSGALTAVGILVGVVGAAAMTRYLEGLLFGVTPLDAQTFVAVSLLFAAIATLASYLPARRAATLDPLIAIRCE
jgi:putative ABC transport system permease protein